MTYTVTIAGGKKDVVLPNGGRYQAGAVVTLSDEEYAQLSLTAVPGLMTSSFLGGDYTHTVTIEAGQSNVVLPNGIRYSGGQIAVLSDDEWSTVPAALNAPALSVIQAVPVVHQHIGGAAGTVTVTLNQATGLGIAAGTSTSLVACVTTDGAVTNPAVSGITLGGAAGRWQAAVTDPGTTQFGGAIWYDPGCAAGQTSVAVSVAGGTVSGGEVYVSVYEVTGVLVFDQGSCTDSGVSSTVWTSGLTPVTSRASEIFFGAASNTAAIPTVTGSGSWTTQSSGLGTYDQIAGYQVVSARGQAAFSGTVPSGTYSALVATFYSPLLFSSVASEAG